MEIGKMSNVEVMDVRGACCLSTAGVSDRLESLSEGEILEVVLDETMYDALSELVGEKNCEILETKKEANVVRVRLQKKKKMLKVKSSEDYPIESGSYLRGNDFSPVAVAVLLNAPRPLPNQPDTKDIKIPPNVENLVRVAVETGAALAGTLQTENIGIEKLVCNVVGNPNIRYIVLCGEEVNGHYAGDALRALLRNGINDRRTIIGTKAPTPYLFNIPREAIVRFRRQTTLIDFTGEMNPEVISKVVWSCYQEPDKPAQFKDYTLFDHGAYPEPAISCRLTGVVEHPEEIEEWELDEIAKKIKTGGMVEEKKVVEKVMTKDEKFVEIGKRLAKVSEELLVIAKIFMGEEAAVEAPTVEVTAPRVEVTLPKEEELSKVEEMEILYFENQLREYNAVFAAFNALKSDMCGGGLNLPLAVNKAIKKLENLRQDVDKSPMPAKKKGEIDSRINNFLKQAEELPTEPGPCQKTAGNCKIGPGCFANGALDILKLITEPKR
jgi:tetrahydromethanopterin S-methyltransferase subunit A